MPVVESYLPEFLSSQTLGTRESGVKSAPILLFAIIATALLAGLNYLLSTYELRGDNDAMLRLVEVRDLIGGQGWFDMQQYRMGMPGGFEMHWSRLIDAPIAGLILLAQTFGISNPENFAAFVWPLLLSFVALYATLRIAFVFGGMAAIVFTLIIAVPSFQLLALFPNGSIDHHNAQAALGLTFVMAVTALLPSWKSGALAGICLALMSGIGAETQAHVALGGVAIAILYLFAAHQYRNIIIGFGFAFAAANIAIFLGTIAPAFYARATCDAFSIAQALPSVVGGLGLAIAAMFSHQSTGFRRRFILLVLVGAASFASALPASLNCIADPMAGVDPLVQKFWLAYVEEAKPLLTVMHEDLYIGLAFVMPACIGILSAIFLLIKSPRHRLLAGIIGGSLLASLAISFYQFRASVFSAHLAVPLLGIAAAMVFKWADEPGKNIGHRLLMAGFVLACLNHTWAISTLVLEEVSAPAGNDVKITEKACSGPAFIAALNAIPKTTFMAVSNLGPDILVDTNHRVLAGPYHRNIAGIKSSIEAHILPSAQSKMVMIKSGATHYIWCPSANETFNFSKENGFAADMLAGNVPDWLKIVTTAPNGDYAIYKIMR